MEALRRARVGRRARRADGEPRRRGVAPAAERFAPVAAEHDADLRAGRVGARAERGDRGRVREQHVVRGDVPARESERAPETRGERQRAKRDGERLSLRNRALGARRALLSSPLSRDQQTTRRARRARDEHATRERDRARARGATRENARLDRRVAARLAARAPTGRVHARRVALADERERLVERRPAPHARAELVEARGREPLEVADDARVEPAAARASAAVAAAAFAAVVERERQVPVVERDERRDVLRVERVEQAVVEARALRVPRADRAVRHEPRPAEREPVLPHAELRHQLDVLAEAVVVVARDVAGVAVRGRARRVRERVPDRRASPALGRRALDLVRGGRRAEVEVRRQQREVDLDGRGGARGGEEREPRREHWASARADAAILPGKANLGKFEQFPGLTPWGKWWRPARPCSR